MEQIKELIAMYKDKNIQKLSESHVNNNINYGDKCRLLSTNDKKIIKELWEKHVSYKKKQVDYDEFMSKFFQLLVSYATTSYLRGEPIHYELDTIKDLLVTRKDRENLTDLGFLRSNFFDKKTNKGLPQDNMSKFFEILKNILWKWENNSFIQINLLV